MKMYFFVVALYFSQLCSAQIFIKSKSGISGALENLEINLKDNNEPCEADEDSPLYQWEEVIHPASSLPVNAVVGGIDYPNLAGKIYLGRAFYNGNLLPAKIRGNDGMAFVSYRGTEQRVEKSEVLCTNNAIWKLVNGTEIPTNAFPVGFTYEGEILYMGRWFVNVLLTPGKVDEYSKILEMTYSNTVYRSSEYEILIIE